MLVIMKWFGCRSMNLARYFSDVKVSTAKSKRKLNRNLNYYVPVLSESRKQSIKTIVSLQMSGQYLGCTTLLRDGNVLTNWKIINLPEDMNKFHLDNVYNSVVEIIKNLPKGDVYVIENHIQMPSNVNIAGAHIFYVKLQTLAMLIALINSDSTLNTSINTKESMNKVILMKARLHARLFKIIVGTEIISSQELTEIMLKGTFPEYVTPVVPTIDAILTYRSAKEPFVKELMSNSLMLAMTFVDVVLNSNLKSFQALSETSKRKLKTTDKN